MRYALYSGEFLIAFTFARWSRIGNSENENNISLHWLLFGNAELYPNTILTNAIKIYLALQCYYHSSFEK